MNLSEAELFGLVGDFVAGLFSFVIQFRCSVTRSLFGVRSGIGRGVPAV